MSAVLGNKTFALIIDWGLAVVMIVTNFRVAAFFCFDAAFFILGFRFIYTAAAFCFL
jgi:hypothetical protein